ncbi:PQQ-binding-like beta-propeller repeat protein, partial [Streptomyces sp. NPDC127084]|uniref:outer membrane protein assembly factor BamB family protein n=1 Tax=Streptomyces sp. NPDC127084 TaxID=3347133 RepID=UPI0036681FD3
TGHWVTSPAVANGAVIVGSADGLISLEAATGSALWRTPTDKSLHCAPTVTGDRIHVGCGDGLLSFRTKDGSEHEDFPGGGPVRASSATVVDGIAYFGSDDGHLYGVDAETAQQRLAFPTADSVDSTPAVVGGVAYFGSDDGHLYAVDTVANKQLWRFAAKGTFFTESSPRVSDGVLYIGTYGGELLAITV